LLEINIKPRAVNQVCSHDDCGVGGGWVGCLGGKELGEKRGSVKKRPPVVPSKRRALRKITM
jgi:hypothetical protein